MTEKSESERILQTETDIAALYLLIQQFLDRSAERSVERDQPSPRPFPSVSNPPSEGPDHFRHYPEPQRESVPKTPSGIRHLKPATPNDFSGDRTKGQAFLNSCELYITLAPHQFVDDSAKIMWALSFMKSDRAARFVDRHMRNYQSVGSLPYSTWQEFVVEFIAEFCPKNEIQTARTVLETSKYFQGSRTVDEYVDDFREMVERARYFEGAHIVMKFRQGLNPNIQDHVACLTSGRPSDDLPREWYAAATLCDENCIANEAFRSSSRIAPRPEVPRAMGSSFGRPLTKLANPTPSISRYAPPIATVSNPSLKSRVAPVRATSMTPIVCFRCGQSGHLRPECPKHFDVRYMDFEERQTFAQDAFAALDVLKADGKDADTTEEEVVPGFGLDSE